MMRRRTFQQLVRVALLTGALCLANTAQARSAASPTRQQADDMAAGLVAKMTLDEKLGQLVNVAPAIQRLNIPAYNWWTESLHGAIGAVPTTNFPEPIGLAATFDAPLVHDVANTISTEVRALHTLGRQTGNLGEIAGRLGADDGRVVDRGQRTRRARQRPRSRLPDIGEGRRVLRLAVQLLRPARR